MGDFDKIVAIHDPNELIEFLDKIYNAFDQMCNIHGLQKVETVGKTYMAVAGCRTFERKLRGNSNFKVHHTVKALNFAFEIIDYEGKNYKEWR
ncbi:MAG: hypothetical protein IPK55_12205 [Streptococcus sp.]|nr:hypothetical protein [Streptococcus sp.]